MDQYLFANPGRVKGSHLKPELGTVAARRLRSGRWRWPTPESRARGAEWILAASLLRLIPPIDCQSPNTVPGMRPFAWATHSIGHCLNELIVYRLWIAERTHPYHGTFVRVNGSVHKVKKIKIKNKDLHAHHKPINSLLQDNRPSVHPTILLSAA